MTVLSLPALARLAEREVRNAGQPLLLNVAVARLARRGVDRELANAGIRIALIVGRIEETHDLEGRRCLTIPTKAAA